MGEPHTGSSRAGRNLPAAIASGIVLGAIAAVGLFTWHWIFVALVVVALLVATYEFLRTLAGAGIRLARTPLFAATAIIPVVAYVYGTTAFLAATGLAVLAVLVWRVRHGHEGYVRDVTASTFVLAYLPFMAGFVMLTFAAGDGPARVVVFILLTISNDIGGYAAGVALGRHPIAPHISPKKSWEGFAGSVVLQCVVGGIAFSLLLDAPWWQGVIAGFVLTLTATAGDFAESAIKRDLGVKDMGTLLPGHGGVMDRLDSLAPNAFASWALFTWFLGSA